MPTTGTQILFEDNFSNSGQPLSSSAWQINKWYDPSKYANPSFLGITQIRQTLPLQSNGHAVIQLDTWQPTGYPAYGNGTSFWGSEAISQKAFDLNGGGVAFEGKFKYGSTQGGMITGFFAYQKFPEDPPVYHANHDELDFEILTTQLGKISTNVFVDQPGTRDNPKSIAVAPGSLAEYHTYRMEWLPNSVTWYVDGNQIRTITNTAENPHAVPTNPMQLHLNLWGVPSGGDNYSQYYPEEVPWTEWWGPPPGDPSGPPVSDKNFRPVHDQSLNQKYYFDVSAVKVERLSTQIGDASANALTGTANNDSMEGGGGNDTLNGMAGNDTMMGGSGSDAMDGGEGTDTAMFTGARSDYSVSTVGAVTTVTDIRPSSPDGTDTLTNVEVLSFSDGRFDLSASGVLTPIIPSILSSAPHTELVSHPDAYATLQGQSLTVGALASVLANDQGGSGLKASLVEGPKHGALQLNSDGTFNYSPTDGFAGVDNFVYRVTDTDGVTGEATAALQVVALTPSGTLDLLGVTPEQGIAAIYAGLLGRVADSAGFNYWVDQLRGEASTKGNIAAPMSGIANAFGTSAEAHTLAPLLAHPAGSTDVEVATFVNMVYSNLFNRVADSDGLNYWVSQIKPLINSGQPVGSVVANIISGTQSPDIAVLMNKVAVSVEYAVQQGAFDAGWREAGDVAAAASLIGSVTADVQTALVGIQQAHALITGQAL